MNETKKATDQMELCLRHEPRRPVRRIRPRQQRLARAAWWFREMHRVVDQSVDWPALPGTRA
jgi:hypothetical protein